ncbi:hypothetical protein RB195_024961 [Necator americanus]|uniref:Phlebovirus glycoprotein G2 fusion domain-containing protein n=1 Tax=Necator americanus TaxID=51031 RepID=A0ABR1EQA6_NECAM
MIPELEVGNRYPGVTACVESCGGPGCDCFYWSSGCLFYRIYLTPNAPEIYEVLRCSRWTEATKVKFTHTDALRGTTESLVALMQPNVPVRWNSFAFTLSSLTIPPITLLNIPFITDGVNTALWEPSFTPALHCPTAKAAEELQCDVFENCTCYSAETKANCKCKSLDIAARFQNLQYRLPVVTPSLSFRRERDGTIQARVPAMATSEIIMTFQDDLSTELLVDDAICTVSSADRLLQMCERCFSSRNMYSVEANTSRGSMRSNEFLYQMRRKRSRVRTAI